MKHLSSLLRTGLSVALLMLLWLTGPAAQAQAPAWQSAVAIGSGGSIKTISAVNGGDVYLVGSFYGSASFGSITLVGAGGQEGFVAKWSSANNGIVWAQRVGGTGNDEITGLALNGASLYISGTFSSGTVDFGSTTVTNASSNGSDAYVAKLVDAGATARFVWVQQLAGSGNETSTAVALSGTNVYVAGTFTSPAISFGTTALSNVTTTGSSDGYIAKLVDDGNTSHFAWAQRFGGDNFDYVTALVVNGGNVYLAGGFSGTAGFGNTTLTNSSSAFSLNVFVAKLTDTGNTGNFEWAQYVRSSGTIGDYALCLAVNGSSVYVAGDMYSPTATFGSNTLVNRGPASTTDIFIAKLTDAGSTGSFVWVQQVGGTRDDNARALVVQGASVCLAGYFSSLTCTIGSTVLLNAGPQNSADVLVLKLTDSGSASTLAWGQRAGGSGGDSAFGMALLDTGKLYISGGFSSQAAFGATTLTSIGGIFLASLTDPTLTATAAPQSGLSFALAPNPARTTATLTLPALPGTATATLTLHDALGRALRTETLPLPAVGLRHELDLRGLAPGLYAVQVLAGPAAATRRLVVE